MKIKKRILSMAMAVLLAINSSPVYAASGGSQIPLSLNGNIESYITDKEYDGLLIAPFQFSDSILAGIELGDDVHLVATKKFDAKNVGNVNVTLSDFRLEGENAENYELPEIAETVTKQVKITKKKVKIAPKHLHIYYGQTKPEQTNEIADYSSQIISGDIVNITAKFQIQYGQEISNNYSVQVDGTIGCDNTNYKGELDSEVKFSVLAYEPTEIATTNTNDYVGVKKATLTAPDGFSISTANKTYSSWSSSIEINLTETQSGTADYYLRNNNSADTEYYNAISTKKTYNYTSIQNKSIIYSSTIEKVDPNSTINFLDSSAFVNGSVNVIVVAKGTAVQKETEIYLGEDGDYIHKTGTAEVKDGIYYYTAVFLFDVPVGTDYFLNRYLKAYTVNSSGTGEKVDVEFIYEDGNGNTNKLTIDNIKPNVDITSIDGNYQNESIKADVTISDLGSGIAKVEYMWDTQFILNGTTQNNYVEFGGYSSGKTNYQFSLSHNDAKWCDESKHTLHLRVTDKSGNVCESELKDAIGSDMLRPNITSVEIRKAESSSVNSILRFLSLGNFANDTIEVAVVADDNEEVENTFASGVNSVMLNGRMMTKNETGEYVCAVSLDEMISDMQIKVIDNANSFTTVAVTDISGGTGLIESNNLIVENGIPAVEFNFSSAGHADDLGNIWFGTNDKTETLTIKALDNKGAVNSGLYSIKITDNGNSIFSKSDFTTIQTEHQKTLNIGDFNDGFHTVAVVVEDNAGNIHSDVIKFYIDCVLPGDSVIAVKSPDCSVVDGDKWFDKDEIITFCVKSSDVDSGLDNISIMINSKEFSFSRNQIETDENGYFVTVTTEGVNPDSEHKYTITGSVTDIANNLLTLAPLTVYKDFENPTVKKLTAEKKNGTLSTILNVLTFGAYSNDTLIFKAYSSDSDFDSGVDYATVNYDGLAEPLRMKAEGNGVFSVEISAGANVFQSDLVIVVFDKCGKSSIICPNIQSAEDGGGTTNGVFVMIETGKPIVSINMPAGDGITRTDGQMWYNSNKTIKITAQDENSGIRNIDLKVNGFNIMSDKNNAFLLKASDTELSTMPNTAEQSYTFDTDFFASKVGEASDGKYTINTEITDNSGNITTNQTVYYIDKVAPKIDKIQFAPETVDGITDTSVFLEKLEYGFYFQTAFTLIINVFDESSSSGLNEVKYRFVPYQDGKKQPELNGTQKITNGKANIEVPNGFKGQVQVFVEALDNAGNRSGEKTTKEYVVDNLSPNINISNNTSTTYKDASGNNLYASESSFTVTVTDTVSGIKEIGCYQNSEKESYNRKIISLNNAGYAVGDSLGDGWIVSNIDANLVTKATKTFSFKTDDNDIVLTFDATDRSGNKEENFKSEKFTIDKTSPIINVVFRNDDDSDLYYNNDRIADITVIDRNFDSNQIKVFLENKLGSVPLVNFAEKSNTEHSAVVIFDEGDYTFNLSGTDLGNQKAIINFSGGNENTFYVDKTKPIVEENFASFSNKLTEDSFNMDKTVTIKVTDHNFNPDYVKLRILNKGAGEAHNNTGMTDVTAEILRGVHWISAGTVHTISFTVSKDAVYQIEITPSDLAGNQSDQRNTTVFEIDKTAPKLQNPNDIKANIYIKSATEQPSATVTFNDKNIKEISIIVKKGMGLTRSHLKKGLKAKCKGQV